jgi:predicted phosphodiesterase
VRRGRHSAYVGNVRLGLIGDVHAEDELLARTLDRFARERVDRVLCTGDIVDGHGDVDRACSLLTQANAVIVRGNHDRWIRSDEMRNLPLAHKMTQLSVDSIALLKGLPSTVTLDVPAFARHPPGKLLLCHGVGANDMARLNPDDRGYAISSNEDLLAILFNASVHVMVGGHTHRPFVRRFERASGKCPLWVVNPGTLAREHEPGFAILDLAAARVDFHRLEPTGAVTHVSCAVLT